MEKEREWERERAIGYFSSSDARIAALSMCTHIMLHIIVSHSDEDYEDSDGDGDGEDDNVNNYNK